MNPRNQNLKNTCLVGIFKKDFIRLVVKNNEKNILGDWEVGDYAGSLLFWKGGTHCV